MVETQLCKQRDTSDTLGVLVLYSICNIMVFVNYINDMVVILSSTSFMVGRSRVLYIYSS